jgi:hypothetical protein
MQSSMPDNDADHRTRHATEFAAQAADRQTGLLGEVFAFLRAIREWWLAPIILLLLLAGVAGLLGGTAAASFIYTLF